MDISLFFSLLTITVTLIGVAYEVDKTRKLSRKTTAIQLLNDEHHNEAFTEKVATLIRLKLDGNGYNWKVFAKKKFSGQKLDEQEQKISGAVRDVLNYYEFLSIAILSKSANEEIIKASQGSLFEVIYDEVKDYIEEARTHTKDPDIYINFGTVVKNWKAAPSAVGPID